MTRKKIFRCTLNYGHKCFINSPLCSFKKLFRIFKLFTYFSKHDLKIVFHANPESIIWKLIDQAIGLQVLLQCMFQMQYGGHFTCFYSHSTYIKAKKKIDVITSLIELLFQADFFFLLISRQAATPLVSRPEGMCKPHYSNLDFSPLSNGIYLLVSIKKKTGNGSTY